MEPLPFFLLNKRLTRRGPTDERSVCTVRTRAMQQAGGPFFHSLVRPHSLIIHTLPLSKKQLRHALGLDGERERERRSIESVFL